VIGTHLIRQQTLLLQDVGFKLQDRPSISSWYMSNLFEAIVFDHLGLFNWDIYPTTRNSKSIQRNVNTPMAEHCNKWKRARNIKGTVFGIIILPFPSLGAIILLESGVQPDKKDYQIIISHFPECSCYDFLNMAVVSIGKRGQCVNCKHLYYIFCYFCKMNCGMTSSFILQALASMK
jgi:hypothetical protein